MEKLIFIGIVTVVVLLILFIRFLVKRRHANFLEKTLSDFGKVANTESFEKTLADLGSIAARAQNTIINNNEELLKETADKTAYINKDAMRTMAHAVKEGFTDNDVIYCKHCGSTIDADSRFCKSCGKEQ